MPSREANITHVLIPSVARACFYMNHKVQAG